MVEQPAKPTTINTAKKRRQSQKTRPKVHTIEIQRSE
jgi:hypothetical protein